ncbi:hypothetical protein FA13DRAFT_1720315 [Coprinellus micaceus]|uniref:Uncharacterized protein n=1 Tax=Coprinellus micaceus TaxID=71717 RepID=A0A4Y7S9Z5_COPMI|nr:hypothetical protein FA13DRAFT_1720315 [Coprinellus micaceus]
MGLPKRQWHVAGARAARGPIMMGLADYANSPSLRGIHTHTQSQRLSCRSLESASNGLIKTLDRPFGFVVACAYWFFLRPRDTRPQKLIHTFIVLFFEVTGVTMLGGDAKAVLASAAVEVFAPPCELSLEVQGDACSAGSASSHLLRRRGQGQRKLAVLSLTEQIHCVGRVWDKGLLAMDTLIPINHRKQPLPTLDDDVVLWNITPVCVNYIPRSMERVLLRLPVLVQFFIYLRDFLSPQHVVPRSDSRMSVRSRPFGRVQHIGLKQSTRDSKEQPHARSYRTYTVQGPESRAGGFACPRYWLARQL